MECVGKEEEAAGDRAQKGRGPRPYGRGLQEQKGQEGFHDTWKKEET